MFKSKQILILFLIFLFNLNLLASDNKKQQNNLQTNSRHLLNQVTDNANIQKIIGAYLTEKYPFWIFSKRFQVMDADGCCNLGGENLITFLDVNRELTSIFDMSADNKYFVNINGKFINIYDYSKLLEYFIAALKENKFYGNYLGIDQKDLESNPNLLNISKFNYDREFGGRNFIKYCWTEFNKNLANNNKFNSALIDKIKGHNQKIDFLLFSNNGKYLASSEDRTIKIWDLNKKQLIVTLNNFSKIINLRWISEIADSEIHRNLVVLSEDYFVTCFKNVDLNIDEISQEIEKIEDQEQLERSRRRSLCVIS